MTQQPRPPDRAPVAVTSAREQRGAGQSPARRRPGRRSVLACAAAGVIAAAGLAGLAARPAGRQQPPDGPARLAACAHASPVPCWGQDPLHAAYGTGALYADGITGKDTTIAVVMPDAGPWAARYLAAFDRHYRLPAARLQVLAYDHALPERRGEDRTGWEQEGAADLELAHYMAPGARLAFVATPGATAPRLGGLRAAMDALGWLSAREQVDVASFSYGTWEPRITALGPAALPGLRAGLAAAASRGVSVIAGTGDDGPSGPAPGGGWYAAPVVTWPASDPLATGVSAATIPVPGGPPPSVSRDPARHFAPGAGLSALFPRPPWQAPAARIAGDHRAVADISMAARAWVYIPGASGTRGWYHAGGTSLSAPLLAGLAACAAQLAGHPLGPLGPALYRLRGAADGITDVTAGTNADHGLPGYKAGPGYDLPSGIGTVGNAARFAAALARLSPGAPGRAAGSGAEAAP